MCQSMGVQHRVALTFEMTSTLIRLPSPRTKRQKSDAHPEFRPLHRPSMTGE
jgi:hypothetical protein